MTLSGTGIFVGFHGGPIDYRGRRAGRGVRSLQQLIPINHKFVVHSPIARWPKWATQKYLIGASPKRAIEIYSIATKKKVITKAIVVHSLIESDKTLAFKMKTFYFIRHHN